MYQLHFSKKARKPRRSRPTSWKTRYWCLIQWEWIQLNLASCCSIVYLRSHCWVPGIEIGPSVVLHSLVPHSRYSGPCKCAYACAVFFLSYLCIFVLFLKVLKSSPMVFPLVQSSEKAGDQRGVLSRWWGIPLGFRELKPAWSSGIGGTQAMRYRRISQKDPPRNPSSRGNSSWKV